MQIKKYQGFLESQRRGIHLMNSVSLMKVCSHQLFIDEQEYFTPLIETDNHLNYLS
jgi:hypothetical protein